MARRPESQLTEEIVRSATDKINALRAQIDPSTLDPSKDERKEQAPARKGFETHFHRLITLAQEKGINIERSPRDMLIKEMENDLKLRQLTNLAGLLYNRILDSYRANHANVWDGFLAYYRILSAMCQVDPEVESALKPIISFMAINSNHDVEDPAKDVDEV